MNAEQATLGKYVFSLLDEGQKREEIESLLLQKGHDEAFVKTFVGESIKLRHNRRRSQGLSLILVGATICFLSFLLTITSSFSHASFPWVLYGLTSVGIIIVFAGFTRIF